MITRTRFVIAVPDLKISSAFYRDVLGFTIHTVPDPGWLFYTLGECMIMAGECRDAIPPSKLGDLAYFAHLSGQAEPHLRTRDQAAWLDRLEVTNEQFKQFADAAGYKTEAEKQGTAFDYINDKWELVPSLTWLTPRGSGSSISDKAKHPVVFVSWNDASAYCAWAGKRLPT